MSTPPEHVPDPSIAVVISVGHLVEELRRGNMTVAEFFAAVSKVEDSLPRHGALRVEL